MMTTVGIIIAICIWNLVGLGICTAWSVALQMDGLELCNPCWVYYIYQSVNWFGAIIISLVYTVICPIGAVCYWFCKLCTVGRD